MTGIKAIGATAFFALTLAACGSQPSTSASTSSSSSPSASASPSATASAAAAASPVVMAQTVGSNGMILVAASDSMTLYTFDSDSAGKSNCSGQCAVIWPPLTVPTGVTPTAGPGVTGQLGTITRSDGAIQVTYKGLPLYFFHNDSKPGDTKGHYTGWELVHP